MRVGDQEFTRMRVLKTLRRTEPIARTRLAQLCGLTGNMISEIITDLIQRDLVVEERVPTGGRGRPRLDLRVNAKGAYVIGAYSGWRGGLHVEIVDLGGVSVFSHFSPMAETNQLDVRAHQIAEVLAEAIALGPVAKDLIKNVAVSLPAMVDSRTGQVEHYTTFEPGPSAYGDIISGSLGIPTMIEGEVNVLARAEHWFGDGSAIEDLITIAFNLGLGAAHYKEGGVSTGAHGVNPELGHVKAVLKDGRACVCGASGCLQAYTSISAIVYEISRRKGLGLPPFYLLPSLLRHYIEAANAGDAVAREAIEEAGRYLGVAISNLVNFNDPDRIVVFFGEPDLIDLVAPSMYDAIDANTLPALRGRVAVKLKPLDDDLFLKGAAAVALELFYRDR